MDRRTLPVRKIMAISEVFLNSILLTDPGKFKSELTERQDNKDSKKRGSKLRGTNGKHKSRIQQN